MRAFPNQESFVKGNDCAVSRRPLCFQMDTFPSSDFGLLEQSALLSKKKTKKQETAVYKMIQSLWNNNSHVPKIAYFPRNELAMNLCFLWRCAEGAKRRRITWKTVGRSADVPLDTARPAGPDIVFLPLLWTGTILGRRVGKHARLSRSSALLRKFTKSVNSLSKVNVTHSVT